MTGPQPAYHFAEVNRNLQLSFGSCKP
jgi:hypothetical protein